MNREQLQQELQKTREIYASIKSTPARELAGFSESTRRHHYQALERLEAKGKELRAQLDRLDKEDREC